jgi:TonB-dependent starch-binding outer membrane protein SusC
MKKKLTCHDYRPLAKQIVRKMKLTILLVIVAALSSLAIDSYSQAARLTLNMENNSIKNVLNEIEKQSEFRFFYSGEVDVESNASVSVSNKNVMETLDELFQGTGIRYEIFGRQIALLAKQEIALPTGIQQAGVITGRVTDRIGSPLPGVTVVIKGTTTGTITDGNGNYNLSNIPENASLVFSFVGMKTQEVVVGNQTVINASLQDETIGIEEVVAVGYGTMKKSDLTGSVVSVKSDQLVSFPVSGAVQALQGRAAGVQISSNNGDPGGSMRVRVRGGTSINASSDPIFVVDGFVGGILPPPEDIESIEILKDASATAIYGSRGANGVIMVTTKKGTKGKTRIEFNTSYSSQKEIKRLDLLNAQQYTEITKEAFPNYVSSGDNTDWQDVIFQNGAIQNYQLSFSGGNDNVNYYLSGLVYDQEGVIIGSGFNKYSITSNINLDATEKLKIGLNLFGERSLTDGVPTQEISGGADQAGVVGSALKFMPDQGIYRTDGTYTTAAMHDPIDNPYAIIKEFHNNNVGDRLQANFSAEYKLLKDLSFKTTFGTSTFNNRNGEYLTTLLNRGRSFGGLGTIRSSKNTNLASENYFSYNTTFAKVHRFGAMAGYSYQTYRNENWMASGSKFITDAVSFWNLGGGAVTQIPSSSLTEGKLASFYSRVNYGFNDKYLITFNARYDGSSNFSKNHKWAFFPSGAIAWNMKNEPFMNNISAINQWKWRGSYGVTGNQAIAAYQTLARLTNVFSIVNGVAVNAVRPSSVANDDLTWETTAQMNIGTDIGFFDSRLNLTVDYYRMVTSDLLFSVPLPQYSGYSTQLKNIGKVENKGFEFTVSGKILTGQLKWNMDMNLSANRNEILELPDGKDILYGSGPGHLISLGNTQILRVGAPVGSMYGYIYDGVYQQGDTFIPGSGFEQVAGGEKFRDIDGKKDANGNLTGEADGTLNASDQTIIGNPHPKFIYGFNNELKWRSFDLNIFIQGSQGNDILSYTLLELETLGKPINSTTRALDRWTPTNTNTDVPKKTAARPERVSTRWIFDGSYVRVKNMVLGYNMPKSVLDKLSIEKLRLYVSAQNMLTITNYRGFDPEVNYRGSGTGADSNRNQGLDYASYPNAKSYTVGLNIVF